MKLRVLGCSGGIGGRHLRTTSLLVDHDILIDAGTGVGDLSMAELTAIDHVFLTHSHLDHIAALPLMIDTVADARQTPLTVHALPAVIEILRQHIFNWTIWPDFSAIPLPERAFLRFEPIAPLQAVVLDGRRITALPVEHTVPAVGYQLDSGAGSLVFSGDTGRCDAFWQSVNAIGNLRYLLIECAFSNGDAALAQASKHLTPQALAVELAKLKRPCEVHVTHLKPGRTEMTMEEIGASLAGFGPSLLQANQVFEF